MNIKYNKETVTTEEPSEFMKGYEVGKSMADLGHAINDLKKDRDRQYWYGFTNALVALLGGYGIGTVIGTIIKNVKSK